MDILNTISLSMGAGWASGINLYATVFVLGFLNSTGNIHLPADLQVLSNPLVMLAAGGMYVVEFFADKIPGLDTVWDSIHTFIRIPAGAILAAGALGDVSPAAELAGAILGGGMAAASHATKAGTRVLINASPEPFTNWIASLSEDVVAVGGLYASLHYPWAFLIGLALFVLLLIWLLPKLWRGIKKLFRGIGRLFGYKPKEEPAGSAAMPTANAPPGRPQPEATAVPAAPASSDVQEKLAELTRLRDAGSISQAEYDQLRAKALQKLVE